MFTTFQSLSTDELTQYASVISYVHDFLKQPHPFRPGSVCPHIARVELSESIHYSVVKSDDKYKIRGAIESSLVHHERNNNNGATILLFPDKISIRRLHRIRNEYNSSAHENGLLLGVLHPNDCSQSKHGNDFYPLRSPMPIVTIRSMILSDLEIFKDQAWSRKTRNELLQGYIFRFKSNDDTRSKKLVEDARQLIK